MDGDEFEIEVTDLRAAGSLPAADGEQAAAGGETHAANAAPVGPSPTPPAGQSVTRRPALRRHLGGGLIASMALVLLAVVLLRSLPDPQATLRAVLHVPAPTATPTLQIGAGTLLLEHTVPWGALRIDGTSPAAADSVLQPAMSGGQQVPSLVLPPGRHLIVYQATPWPALRCWLSVPAASSDTCPLVHPAPEDPVQSFGATRIVDLGAVVRNLPPDQLASLVQATDTMLRANLVAVSMLPGERYLASGGGVAIAAQRLRATLMATVNQDERVRLPGLSNMPCVAICPATWQFVPDSWLIQAHIVVAWRYTRADGQVVASAAPAAWPAISAHVPVLLRVAWRASAWSVTLFSPYITCALAFNLLDQTLRTAGHYQTYTWTQYPTANISDGCLLAGGSALDAQGFPIVPLLLFYRFGLLVAANAAAHAALPAVPLATAVDVALAQQLMTARSGGQP